MVGERDGEVSVTISSAGYTEFHVGRNISPDKVDELLIDKENVLQPNPYTRDYFLCNDCENYFGRIEHECSEIFERLKNQLMRVTDVKEVNLIKLLTLSIVWRCSITRFSKFEFAPGIEEKLKNTLIKKFTKESFSDENNIKEMTKHTMSVLIRPNFSQPEDSYVFLDKHANSPYYFLFAELVCIYYGKLKSTKKTPLKHFGFENLVSKPLNSTTIEIIPEDLWKICVGGIFNMEVSKSYQAMGDRTVLILKQVCEKLQLQMPPTSEIDKFLKYYANLCNGELDHYSNKNYLVAFKKYFFGVGTSS